MSTVCSNNQTCRTVVFYLQKANKTSNNLELLEFLQTKNTENADEFDLYEVQS
jgi:hypothetical protein